MHDLKWNEPVLDTGKKDCWPEKLLSLTTSFFLGLGGLLALLSRGGERK